MQRWFLTKHDLHLNNMLFGSHPLAEFGLNGWIPVELAELSQISIVDVSSNHLNGTISQQQLAIPESMWSLPNLSITADCHSGLASDRPADICPEHCCTTCCDDAFNPCAQRGNAAKPWN